MFYLVISRSVDGREARYAVLADHLLQHTQEERMGGETTANASSVGVVTAQKKGEKRNHMPGVFGISNGCTVPALGFVKARYRNARALIFVGFATLVLCCLFSEEYIPT